MTSSQRSIHKLDKAISIILALAFVTLGILIATFFVILTLLLLKSVGFFHWVGEYWDWSAVGDGFRNISGPLTFGSALLTAAVLIHTSKTRAREAATANFREQMQWASEQINGEDDVTRMLGLQIMEKYASEERSRSLLTNADREIARELQDVVRRVTDLDMLEVGPATRHDDATDQGGRP